MERTLPMGRRPALALIAGLMLVSMAGVARADGATITGSIVYRERMLLPRGAVATVRLEDVSLADAPARLIAETSVPASTSPTAFSIAFDPSQIEAGHTYAWRASITAGDELMFTTTERHSFDPEAASVELLVQRVTADDTATLPLAGAWLAEDIGGGGVIDDLQTTLEIGTDGKVAGNGGCNRFSGSATIEGDRISFGELASTMMACTEAAMDQEMKLHGALAEARSYRIDAEQKKLFLSDASGKVVAQFSAM
jgi:putative lipoprotein